MFLKRLIGLMLFKAPKLFVSDALFLKLRYYITFGKKINLKAPVSFNEKLQWLKLYDRNPAYCGMVDKYEAKKIVAEKIGEEYIIPTLGVWTNFDDIDFQSLPDQFVLKCTHDSGGLVIVKDKNSFDKEAAKEKITKALNTNYYLLGREWPYKHIEPRIIAEKYMVDEPEAPDLTDYKFFCFDGKVDCVMVCLERSSGETKFYFFNQDWKLKRLNIRGKNAPEGFTIPKPKCMDEMFQIAAELSKGMPFVRVDLYQSNGQVYFGELTFYPASGFDANLLPETDEYFGSLINIKK